MSEEITAQDHLRIQTVFLKSSKVFLHDEVLDASTLTKSDLNVVQSYRAATHVGEGGHECSDEATNRFVYCFIYSVGIRLIPKADEELAKANEYLPLFEIAAEFRALYLSTVQLNSEQIDSFKTDNVGYHVWPYWREFAQSMCARVGMYPVFEIPVYRVGAKIKN